MTRESRLLLSLDEIIGLRWQCNKCGSAISYQLDQSVRLPQACPSCYEPLTESPSFGEFQEMQAFIDTLKGAIRVQRSKKLGGTLKLELVEDPR